jgi:hypothetical protein
MPFSGVNLVLCDKSDQKLQDGVATVNDQSFKPQRTWLLTQDEAVDQLMALDDILEKPDENQLDWACPEWRCMTAALHAWLEVETDRSQSALFFVRSMLAAEKSAVKSLRDMMPGMQEFMKESRPVK